MSEIGSDTPEGAEGLEGNPPPIEQQGIQGAPLEEGLEEVLSGDGSEEVEDFQGAPLGEGSDTETTPLGDEDFTDLPDSTINPLKVLELGDRILLIQTVEGAEQIYVGTIYYRTNELLKLKTDGNNTKLIEFNRLYTEDEDRFEDESITTYMLMKRTQDKFREQQQFEVGFILQGWQDGSVGSKYKITKINLEKDEITVIDINDPTDEKILDFDYRGIPLTESFDILNITELAPEDVSEEETKEEEAGEEEEEEEEGPEFEKFDYVYAPAFQKVEYVDAARERITEEVQKNSALADFVNVLPPKDQENPLIVRDYRILVEVLSQMKQDITDYAIDGSVRGVIDPSVDTLVDLVKRTQVPNGRPVFKMNKRLFVESSNWNDPAFNEENERDNFTKADDNQIMDNYKNKVGFAETGKTKVKGEILSTIPFYETQKVMNSVYERPWANVTKYTEPIPIKVSDDVQALRQIVPFTEDLQTIKGYVPVDEPMTERERFKALMKHAPPSYPMLGDLYLGTEQVLTTTYRKGEKGGKIALLPSEATTDLVSYLIFPNTKSFLMGSKRSGLLALDMFRAQEYKQSLNTIILDMDGVPKIEDMNSSTIIRLDVAEGGVMNNYDLAEYLKGMNFKGLSFNDFMLSLEDYGVSRLDLSKDIRMILKKKMTQSQAQLKLALNAQRRLITKIQPPEPNPILTFDIAALIGDEPFLKDALKAFLRENGILKDSDVAFFVYMLHHYNDFFQAKLGNQTNISTKERLIVGRTKALHEREIAKILKDAELYRALVPVPNLCKHVAELKGIRQEEDETLFMKKLSQFLLKYQGARKPNDRWTYCTICKQHLLCEHEYLLIRASINPGEAKTIEKEIRLRFSDGMSHGQYICNECGQAIDTIEYENTMMFDDEGRPMSGNAVLIDTEKLDENELENLLNIPLEEEVDKKRTDEQNAYFQIIKDLALNVGLNFKNEVYHRFIADMQKLNTSLSQSMTGYEQSKYKMLVNCAAALILIEVQTASIAYTPFKTLDNYKDAGFGGYPLEENEDMTEGITYMAYNIATFMLHKKDRFPWKDIKYIINKKQVTTLEEILRAAKIYLTNIIDKVILQNPIIIYRIEKKRQELTETETGTKFQDGIPRNFLPNKKQYGIPIEKGVAEATGNVRVKSLYWLKGADGLAAKTQENFLDPLSVSILCCRSPVSNPESYWIDNQESLIALKEGRHLVPRVAAKSLQPHFEPRSMEAIVTDIPNDKLYALFLKVCYKGDHIGRSHEPDINHTCIWCGFKFGKPYSLMNHLEAVQAVNSNPEIVLDMETFKALLDKVHENYKVEMPALMIGDAMQVIPQAKLDFGTMDPPPMKDWTTLYTEISDEFEKHTNEKGPMTGVKLGEILGPLSDAIRPMKEFVRSKYAKQTRENAKILEGFRIMVSENFQWINFIQVLETYFIKPCQNIYYGYSAKVPLSFENKKWDQGHMMSIKEAIKKDRNINEKFAALAEFSDRTKAVRLHLKVFIEQMTVIVSFRNRIHPSYFIGRDATFQVFKEAFLYGPLYTLYHNCEGGEGVSAEIQNMIHDMIGQTIINFMDQRLTYDDEQVKLIIADSAEREKQAMLSDFKKLSEDQKKLLRTNMALKLGRFQIGVDWRNFAKYSAEGFDTRTAELDRISGLMSLSGDQAPTNRPGNNGYDNTQHASDE